MRSRFVPADAARITQELGPHHGADLALRIYSSRLLGADPALVLHGGGNTSVKAAARERTGEPVEVLYVKGSGWDLGTIEPAGFSACRLDPLQRLCRLDTLSDDDMVAALRSQLLDPSSPTPSVEALLHAFLPGKFVDHTHADAVLALQDQPNARDIAAEVWGTTFLFIPYVMPGFALAKRVVELGRDLEGIHGLILEQHGIFTWGATAEESYERMIAGVTEAEEWRLKRRPPARVVSVAAGAPDATARRRVQAEIAPRLRGAIVRAGQKHFVIQWRADDAIIALLGRADARAITARGTVTPDHVIRTKPQPLWIDAAGRGDSAAMITACESAVVAYAREYEAYFKRCSAKSSRPLMRLDSAPRVVFVSGVGALTIGRTVDDARIVGDIVARSAQVIQDAESVGSFHPVSEQDLFDVEYWSLEQAKLATSTSTGPLAGQIAFVTGGASGIGLATAEHLLTLGAHVFVTDRAADPLSVALATLGVRFGTRVAGGPCDVTSAADVAAAVEQTVMTFGGIDVLVSNAGTAPQGLLHTAEGEATLERSLEINLLGHQRIARAVTEVMLAQGAGGCLLFNASKSALNQGPEFGPYAVAKAGLLSLMRQYAVDLGAYGIRSNAVNADRIRTELFAGGVLEARAKARGLSAEAYFRQNLLCRETTASDVAKAFGWLAGAKATTGAVITVDGGNAAAFVR